MRLSNYTLTPTRINNAKAKARLYKLSDGGGLFVEVSTTGQKTWCCRRPKTEPLLRAVPI